MKKKPQTAAPRRFEEEKSPSKNRELFFLFLKKNRRLFLNFLFCVLVFIAGFFAIKGIAGRTESGSSRNGENWYSIKLVNEEIYFGQIKDLSADPVAAANVYYDYDQVKNEDKKESASPASNLRLVKRGNETHGPSGEMEIVRSQILFMEKLKPDSKVLKAILNYENGK